MVINYKLPLRHVCSHNLMTFLMSGANGLRHRPREYSSQVGPVAGPMGNVALRWTGKPCPMRKS
jgi:hypothetical protein